ncbi:tetratricopeptide repeat protein [Chitiniphilus shinanonensis]|uniref:tetratricopeptide repeat protein n=2 Tax=Chitiniphilus shinanonensis TaxID=553088 RepID=UPI00035D232E|nr:tetratricopeptide repeat protein [Chitiniphilus shinanonensis]
MSWQADQAVVRGRQAEARNAWPAAQAAYAEALARWPQAPALRLAHGLAACRAGDFAAARLSLDLALRAQPGAVAGWAALAQACARSGDPAAAHQALRHAIRLDPDSVALRANHASVLRELGDIAAARAELDVALRLAPDDVAARYNLGNLLLDEGDEAGAEAAYRAVLVNAPRHVGSRYNLGCIARRRGEITFAMTCFDEVLALQPDHADAWHNLAGCRRALGDWDGARAGYQRALALGEPVLARYALGTLDLLQGRWADGWEGYEARWAACGLTPPSLPLPAWQGEAVPASARLLVYAEQGYGDLLQFARFLAPLRARFAAVTLACPPAVSRLLAHSLEGVTVLDHLPPPADFTHAVALMSLARVLRIDEARLRDTAAPYLRAPAHGGAWTDGGRGPGLNVGLCWTGNPAQRDNLWRSVPLGLLRSLQQIPGITWHNLQQGKGEQARAAGFALRDASGDWRDFADTAAYLGNLDLVITACTSVAHLAGGLGVPVWLVSRYDADWRWLLAREDSPWYPSMRIWRQPSPGNWQGALDGVADALRRLAH